MTGRAVPTFDVEIVWTADRLIITVPYGSDYPSQNTMWKTGKRGGPKTDAYHALRRAVETGARRALAKGFAPLAQGVKHPVSVEVYSQTRIYPDPSNVGKAELDGLEDAGLVANDKYLCPTELDAVPLAEGPSRVIITIRRRFASGGEPKRNSGSRGAGGGKRASARADSEAPQDAPSARPRGRGVVGRTALAELEAQGYKPR